MAEPVHRAVLYQAMQTVKVPWRPWLTGCCLPLTAASVQLPVHWRQPDIPVEVDLQGAEVFCKPHPPVQPLPGYFESPVWRRDVWRQYITSYLAEPESYLPVPAVRI